MENGEMERRLDSRFFVGGGRCFAWPNSSAESLVRSICDKPAEVTIKFGEGY